MLEKRERVAERSRLSDTIRSYQLKISHHTYTLACMVRVGLMDLIGVAVMSTVASLKVQATKGMRRTKAILTIITFFLKAKRMLM